MNIEEIKAQAKSENWKRRQVKNACFEHGVSVEDREAIYADLGMAATVADEPRAVTHAPAKPAPAPKPIWGNMDLKYAATDKLTGQAIEPGTRVTGVKLGGEWDFTAEHVDLAQFRKVCEAALYSLGDDEGGPDGVLDSTDYRLLESFGNDYPYFRRFIGCEVPGLAD